MKVNKYISIDEDVFRQLSRENNASNLINELLKEHFNQKTSENLEILKQKHTIIKQILKENRKKDKEIKKKIDKITEKNKKFFDNFKKAYPDQLINKLKNIENLDYDTALNLAVDFHLDSRGIGGIKLIKIWEEVKKNV